MVLQFYLSKNFSMLSGAIPTEGGSRGRVYPEGFSTVSQQRLYQEIKKRKLVADPVKALIHHGKLDR
jgi:hypothetical protein